MGSLECLQRPGAPPTVVEDYVQQDIGIHQDQGSLTAAGQRQDVLGPHFHSGSASQPGEPILCAPGATAGWAQSYFAFAGHVKVNGGPGYQSQEVSDLFWNGYLALRGYRGGHEVIPSLLVVLLYHESGCAAQSQVKGLFTRQRPKSACSAFPCHVARLLWVEAPARGGPSDGHGAGRTPRGVLETLPGPEARPMIGDRGRRDGG